MDSLTRKIGVIADTIRLKVRGPLHTAHLEKWSATFLSTTPREYHNAHRYTGEKKVLQRFLSSIRVDDVVLDVGANVGVFACFALSAIENGFVAAIEPHNPTSVRLRTNLAQNASENQWRVFTQAFGKNDTIQNFVVKNDMSGFPSNRVSTDGNIEVEVNRADTLIEAGDLPVPDIMKIDVEGAEHGVLEGFGTYLSDVREIFVELHPSAGTDLAAIEDLLRRSGFTIQERVLGENENTPLWHAVKSEGETE